MVNLTHCHIVWLKTAGAPPSERRECSSPFIIVPSVHSVHCSIPGAPFIQTEVRGASWSCATRRSWPANGVIGEDFRPSGKELVEEPDGDGTDKSGSRSYSEEEGVEGLLSP